MTDAILTTDTQLRDLWASIHSSRSSSHCISVSKDALRALLEDHHTLYTALRDRKLLAVTADPDQRSLL